MNVRELIELLMGGEAKDKVYFTDTPEIHKRAGGIAVAAFQVLEPVNKNTVRVLTFTLMRGKQREDIGCSIVFRLEKPDWFVNPMGSDENIKINDLSTETR